jgi:Ser/Thr protein kinase RdoA (MazF antagonist)
LNIHPTPYANLDPSLILSAIESVGYQCSGVLSALNSYENRVYQVGIEDEKPVIAKFYRPDRWSDAAILEEHQFALELLQHEIPIVAPLVNSEGQSLHRYQNFRFALFPRQGGHALEVDNLEHLEWMGRLLGRMHAVSACRPFQHRIRLDVQSYGYQPYQFLLDHHFIPEHIKSNYCRTVDEVLVLVERCFTLVGDIPVIRLHGDCHAGNVLWSHEGPKMVDLDDCLMGPAIQDIWMLLSGNKRDVDLQVSCILDGYQEFYDFNYRELKLIEALRTLRMIHYAGWLAKRWEDPAFPLNFPWFNTPRYWEDQLIHLHDQACLLAQMIEDECHPSEE